MTIQLDLFCDRDEDGAAGAEPVGSHGNPLDRQVGGRHYKMGGIQPIEYIQANGLSFCEGNALKYITRHRSKGGKEDLEKAIHYLEMEIAHSYKNWRVA